MAKQLPSVEAYIYAGVAKVYFSESIEDISVVTREELDDSWDLSEITLQAVGWGIDSNIIDDPEWSGFQNQRVGVKVAEHSRLVVLGDRHEKDVRTLLTRNKKGWVLFLLSGEDTPENEIGNEGFETNTNGWTSTDATLTRSTAEAYEGVASGLVEPLGTEFSASAGIAPSDAVAVTEGETYEMSAQVKFPNGYSAVALGVRWYDEFETLLSSSTGAIQSVDAGKWTRLYLSREAPENAAKASPFVEIFDSPAVSDVFYVDKMWFSEIGSGSSMIVYPVRVSGVTRPIALDAVANLSIGFAILSEPEEFTPVPIP